MAPAFYAGIYRFKRGIPVILALIYPFSMGIPAFFAGIFLKEAFFRFSTVNW